MDDSTNPATAPPDSQADSQANPQEITQEIGLRPKTLAHYVGQPEIKRNLRVFIDAAKNRGQPLDHVLLSCPPGLGKTTLA